MNDSRYPTQDDEVKIREAALDYIGGVLEANPARMSAASTLNWPSGRISPELTASRNYPKCRR